MFCRGKWLVPHAQGGVNKIRPRAKAVRYCSTDDDNTTTTSNSNSTTTTTTTMMSEAGMSKEELFEKITSKYPACDLSENSRTVLSKRYLMRGEDGKPIETAEEMFFRVAYHVAAAAGPSAAEEYTERYYELLSSKKFFPNSPTFTGAGTPLGQLAACFVLPISDDMGRAPDGIMSTLRNAALIQQTGGGNGFSFSRLRAAGSFVKSSGGLSTGPVGFMKVYDQAFGMIAQGGTRRGANMAVLRVDHPDIREFIACKTSEQSITNFNISVGITDEFMTAVSDDADFDLIAPESGKVVETVRAIELFAMIAKHAHANGEPGILFLDEANRHNPVPHLYELESTNPCGEQWLGPYENCCLGSLNLSKFLVPRHDGDAQEGFYWMGIDWASLFKAAKLATRFLDNVVDANSYVESVPQLREAALQCRRIGLGFMGLADACYHCEVRYGSEEAQCLAATIMEFIRYASMDTSIELAREHGPFPAIKGSIYDPDNFTWTPPEPLDGKRGVYRHSVEWPNLLARLKKYGIRNACTTTIAPTGTIATVAGCEGYGCEPAFALAYYRHVNDNGKDLRLAYVSPLFEEALSAYGITGGLRESILERVLETGSCQRIPELPEEIRDTFVVSGDITGNAHVRMQASIQAFVDNSLSKTCNLPADATVDHVADVYMLAWKLKCKGLTVYVTGSRNKVVLETKAEHDKKNKKPDQETKADKETSKNIVEKRKRSKALTGITQEINTPVGKAFVTINEDDSGAPFEMFLNTAKAGSETAAVSEALARLISYIMRIQSDISPKKRLQEVYNQLVGIGGRRAMGFGRNRVLSLADGIAQAISGYLESISGERLQSDVAIQEQAIDSVEQVVLKPGPFTIGDLCPVCGDSALVNEEGCKKCYGCDYSEC